LLGSIFSGKCLLDCKNLDVLIVIKNLLGLKLIIVVFILIKHLLIVNLTLVSILAVTLKLLDSKQVINLVDVLHKIIELRLVLLGKQLLIELKILNYLWNTLKLHVNHFILKKKMLLLVKLK